MSGEQKEEQVGQQTIGKNVFIVIITILLVITAWQATIINNHSKAIALLQDKVAKQESALSYLELRYNALNSQINLVWKPIIDQLL